MEKLDKGMVHVPGGLEQDYMRFHHSIHNFKQFKTYELFDSGIFYLIILDLDWLGVNWTCKKQNFR